MNAALDLQAVALINLLRLSSPALPIGAYSYSQGLEWAIDSGRIRNPTDAAEWIRGALEGVVGCCEAPITARLYRAWQTDDIEDLQRWSAVSLACRETVELRAETLQMGYSLGRLIEEATLADERQLRQLDRLSPYTFPLAYSLAACAMNIPEHAAILGLLWSWLENQIAVTIKSLPLGQAAGQKLLSALSPRLPQLAERACAMALNLEARLDNFAPGLAIASSRHEIQYSRLFRS